MSYSTDWATKRLVDEYFQHNRLIIAFDFDDTFPEVLGLLKRCQREINCKFILYTCRAGETGKFNIPDALKICRLNSIDPDAVNTDIVVDYQTLNHKIFYNILLDDRAGLKEACKILSNALNIIHDLNEDHG